MSYRVENHMRRVWDEVKGEVIDLPNEIYYSVVDHNGRTISEGETRTEELERASEAIMPDLALL